jgi:hypothetical protein
MHHLKNTIKMKNIIIIIAIMLSINTAMAQKEYLDVNKTYTTAKIYQKGKASVLKVSNLKLVSDTLLLFQQSNKQEQFLTSDVRYISVKSGTYAGTYALYGGAVGLLSSILAVLETDPMGESGINWIPFIGGFTAGGAVLGLLIGSTQSKWKTLYMQDKRISYNLRITPNLNTNYCGLGIKVTF